MIDTEFDGLSLQIGRVVGSIATDLNERGVVHATLTLLPRDECILTIQKSSAVTKRDKGSFAFKNDSNPGLVRIEIADTRERSGQPIAERVPASAISAEAIRTRVEAFVRAWLAA